MGTEGQGLRRAVEMAVEEANAAKRFPYSWSPRRSMTAPTRRRPSTWPTSSSPIPGSSPSSGHYNSGCAIPGRQGLRARRPWPMISPAATNPEVTAQQILKDWVGPEDGVPRRADRRRPGLLRREVRLQASSASAAWPCFTTRARTARAWPSSSRRPSFRWGQDRPARTASRRRQGFQGPADQDQGRRLPTRGHLFRRPLHRGRAHRQADARARHEGPVRIFSGDGAKTPASSTWRATPPTAPISPSSACPSKTCPAPRNSSSDYKKRWTGSSERDQALRPFRLRGGAHHLRRPSPRPEPTAPR